MLPWLSARSDCKDQRFIQLGNSLLLSYQWQHLKPGASNLYLCMCMEAGGQRQFQFPRSTAQNKYGIDDASFRRYTRELLEAKFIILVSSGACSKQPNIYAFSDGWKDKKTP
jgi:hypothetical protein